jgi:hypothetical protein
MNLIKILEMVLELKHAEKLMEITCRCVFILCTLCEEHVIICKSDFIIAGLL